jgi:hypothetical protein
MRHRHHARLDRIGDFDRHLDFPGLRLHGDDVLVGDPAAGRVIGMHQQRAAVFALHQRRYVVQP